MPTIESKIKVEDSTQVTEKLHAWKKWFNGAKHFWTVKILPPHK